MGDYQPLQCDGEFDQDCVQAAKILHRVGNDAMTKDDIYFKKPMSPVRKLAFVFSVLICFLTIAVFLWEIPCEWSQCPSKIQQVQWEETLYHLELIGPMQSVHSKTDLSLVSMVRGAEWPSSNSQHQFPAQTGGLVCLQSLTGAVAWWARLSVSPDQLSCSILDLDSNGVFDCLVQGDHGYLVAINSQSGMNVWKFVMKLNKGETIERITFPVIIPDVTGDGVNDLAALCKCHSDDTHINYLVLLSGKDGTFIGKPLKITSCSDIYGLALDDDMSSLYYTCKKQDSYENEVSQKLSDLLSKALNRSVTENWSHRSRLRQLLVSEGLVDFRVANHKMNILNSGHCPTSCSASVNVTDRFNHTVWTYHANYTYVMNPVLIHFNHTITGFVLKFWYWLYPHQESHSLGKDTKMEKIRECIIIIAFNAAGETRIVNASQTDVTRICGSLGCQPDLRYQLNSLLIDDLDRDGYQELVYTSVSFHELSPQEAKPTSPNDFELHSKMQVIRLQAELPKLYQVIAHQ
ncbi:protein FAM234B [Nilaparvata lugens]|uniref:protein FAM234B n=1 Tax=Nilaparvata lugens TaxID=108931 RepID=UPI00193D2B77|nr:protein FAM234B [Nilaparvata lugens]